MECSCHCDQTLFSPLHFERVPPEGNLWILRKKANRQSNSQGAYHYITQCLKVVCIILLIVSYSYIVTTLIREDIHHNDNIEHTNHNIYWNFQSPKGLNYPFTNSFFLLCLHAEYNSWRELRVEKSGLKIISCFSSMQRLHFPVTGENGSALLTISHLTW